MSAHNTKKMKPIVLDTICLLWFLIITKSTRTIGGTTDFNSDVECHSTNDTRATTVPIFPKDFEAHMEVTDLSLNYTAEIHEYVRGNHNALYRTADSQTTTCLFNSKSKRGHIIRGIQCNKTRDLPYQCFCNHMCLPFIPLRDVFAYMERYNAVLANESLKVRGIPVIQWSVRCWSGHNPNITLAIDLYLTRKNYHMARSASYVPVRVGIYGRGDLLKIMDPNIKNLSLIMEITQFKEDISQNEILQAPPGVYCPSLAPSKPFPSLADQFSVTMEAISSEKNTIFYVHHHYDYTEKLVAYELRPHYHTPTSLTRTYDVPKPIRYYRIIHDFQTGVQYMIDERSGNCTISAIPSDAADAVVVDDNNIRLRHANELLHVNQTCVAYQGVRSIRGIPCDVWVAEKLISGEKPVYYTIEIYFTLSNWSVEVEVLNQERQVPLGVAISSADNPTAEKFSNVQYTYYYGYTLGHPNWGNFDISCCSSRIDRLFLILTLQVSYADLARHNLDVATDSIRRGIAGIAGVSPLRITNMFIGKSQDNEVDVWFVLLERPDVIGKVSSSRQEMYMADAYRALYDIIENHEIIINVEATPKKRTGVYIKRGSLERSRESLHPNTRHRGLRYLKAGYTAGSMAGLGFSMAILGTCVGVFVGFLLWKRGSGIPYHVHH